MLLRLQLHDLVKDVMPEFFQIIPIFDSASLNGPRRLEQIQTLEHVIANENPRRCHFHARERDASNVSVNMAAAELSAVYRAMQKSAARFSNYNVRE